jgi:hypothetical protein
MQTLDAALTSSPRLVYAAETIKPPSKNSEQMFNPTRYRPRISISSQHASRSWSNPPCLNAAWDGHSRPRRCANCLRTPEITALGVDMTDSSSDITSTRTRAEQKYMPTVGGTGAEGRDESHSQLEIPHQIIISYVAQSRPSLGHFHPQNPNHHPDASSNSSNPQVQCQIRTPT